MGSLNLISPYTSWERKTQKLKNKIIVCCSVHFFAMEELYLFQSLHRYTYGNLSFNNKWHKVDFEQNRHWVLLNWTSFNTTRFIILFKVVIKIDYAAITATPFYQAKLFVMQMQRIHNSCIEFYAPIVNWIYLYAGSFM